MTPLLGSAAGAPFDVLASALSSARVQAFRGEAPCGSPRHWFTS